MVMQYYVVFWIVISKKFASLAETRKNRMTCVIFYRLIALMWLTR